MKNPNQLINSIETVQGYANLAYGKCRFIIDGTFDDDEKSNLIEILKEIQLLISNAITKLESSDENQNQQTKA